MIITAIAKTSFLENVRQPVYLVLTVLGATLIYLSQYVTLFTLGQETLTIVETAFTTVLMVGLFISIFSSSNLIYYEMENKTLMTVLSKPVKKSQIIIGKFIGIYLAIALSSFILLAAITLTAWMSTQANEDLLFNAALRSYLMKQAVLTLSQLAILLSVTILFACTLPITLTAVFTILLFFLGHMQDLIVRSISGNFFTDTFAFLYSLLIPNLEHFNLSQQLYRNVEIGNEFVVLNVIYAFLYTLIYLLIAMIMFQRKDFS